MLFSLRSGDTMANVADIIESASVNGAVVELIYSKISGIYAVYRTNSRVMVQYADDEALEAISEKRYRNSIQLKARSTG